MKWFKSVFYLFVLFTTLTALAGSYEDFFVAVKRNDGGSVTELLQRGFDPNTPDPSGNIALVLALQAENFAVAIICIVRVIRLILPTALMRFLISRVLAIGAGV